MQINADGLVARTYRVACSIWESFGGHPSMGDKTDLCTVMRYILFLMPLALVINLLALGFAAYSFLFFLSMLWLNLTTVLGIVGFITAVALILGVGMAIIIFGEALTVKATRSETARVVSQYIKAKKQNICPIVEIKR